MGLVTPQICAMSSKEKHLEIFRLNRWQINVSLPWSPPYLCKDGHHLPPLCIIYIHIMLMQDSDHNCTDLAI